MVKNLHLNLCRNSNCRMPLPSARLTLACREASMQRPHAPCITCTKELRTCATVPDLHRPSCHIHGSKYPAPLHHVSRYSFLPEDMKRQIASTPTETRQNRAPGHDRTERKILLFPESGISGGEMGHSDHLGLPLETIMTDCPWS